MSTGFISDWDFNGDDGHVTGCVGDIGSFRFSLANCKPTLQAILTSHTLIEAHGACPGPDYAIKVTFDKGAGPFGSVALNVDEA